MTPRKPRRRGFLLFEVMVAVSVVGIGMAVMLQSIASSLAAAKASRDYLIANNLLEQKLWEVNCRSGAIPGLFEGSFKDAPDFRYRVLSEEMFEETPSLKTVEISAPREALLSVAQTYKLARVTVIVEWKHRQKARRLSAQTYLPVIEEGPARRGSYLP